MEGIYKIALVPSDLTVEETILQIADTLDNLNGIVDDVFARLTTRIKQNTEKTKKLHNRIEISSRKVEKLTGMQNAIKVFSGAKYPTSITHEHYQSIFDPDVYKHKPKKVNLSRKSQGQSNEKELQEKLHFYHVKVAEPKKQMMKDDFNLNSIIDNLSTVGELLIFHTDESPYLGNTRKASAYVPVLPPKVESKSLLEAAPSSIVTRDELKRDADEYHYTPGIGMVPDMEMPLDLPHLPGIAGDVQFSYTSEGSIAPSVITSPISPVMAVPEAELPDLKELHDVKEQYTIPVPDIPDAAQIPAPTVQALPLPPQPPPPPPPPPMDFEIPMKITRDENKPLSAPPPPPVEGDARANLMEAIRNAGGAGRAKLRATAESTLQKDTKKSSGGDLMADLHAKLSMRRRGISGAERSGGSVLHTLASIIPEPDQSTSPRSSSDDDWE